MRILLPREQENKRTREQENKKNIKDKFTEHIAK